MSGTSPLLGLVTNALTDNATVALVTNYNSTLAILDGAAMLAGTQTITGTKTFSAALSVTGALTLGARLVMSAAASVIVPGATSLSFNNNADTLTNLSITDAGIVTVHRSNLVFATTGQRITGDFSNATVLNRVLFQTSTANSTTSLGVIPSGSGTVTQMFFYGGTDPTATTSLRLAMTSTAGIIDSSATGATALDLIVRAAAGMSSLTFTAASALATFNCLVNISTGKGLQIGGSAARSTTEPTNAINLFNGTAPVGTLANGVSLYSAAGELRSMDAGGTSTLLSPHDDQGLWVFDSTDTVTKRRLLIDVEKLLRFLNDHHGLDFVHEFTEAR
jgi:hypothetical protein